MPRYFFHVRKNADLERDPDGTELSSVEDARRDAVEAAQEILAEKVRKGEMIDNRCFEVTAENGKIVLVVPFRSVLHLA